MFFILVIEFGRRKSEVGSRKSDFELWTPVFGLLTSDLEKTTNFK